MQSVCGQVGPRDGVRFLAGQGPVGPLEDRAPLQQSGNVRRHHSQRRRKLVVRDHCQRLLCEYHKTGVGETLCVDYIFLGTRREFRLGLFSGISRVSVWSLEMLYIWSQLEVETSLTLSNVHLFCFLSMHNYSW